MQKVSKAYKESMKSSLRERAYIMISFGLLNQEAQAKATRQRMNLNLTMEDFETQDIQNMSEAEILERKIMLESGNRMSIQA